MFQKCGLRDMFQINYYFATQWYRDNVMSVATSAASCRKNIIPKILAPTESTRRSDGGWPVSDYGTCQTYRHRRTDRQTDMQTYHEVRWRCIDRCIRLRAGQLFNWGSRSVQHTIRIHGQWTWIVCYEHPWTRADVLTFDRPITRDGAWYW